MDTNAEVLKNVTVTFPHKKITSIIGQSGSGKSVLGKSIVQLLRNQIYSGSIFYGDDDLLKLTNNALAKLRGSTLFFIPQDPNEALNPTMKIGEQLSEALEYHYSLSKGVAKKKILNELALYGFLIQLKL
ncbi:ATP-binding cassette domain-containing protein [Veillonella sp.]|uniref:ATP-binding cassette domain-containing protein n=1 Tax=Veillonella sp. TaxID=1926307 RepID=UPI0025F41E3B|nr:ATP-binding cassette domain-containing protein [Veillonella sp.]